jgi:two-component system cell cycle sensor histidine kinase/response regulator CckA
MSPASPAPRRDVTSGTSREAARAVAKTTGAIELQVVTIPTPLRVLIVEDSVADAELVLRTLRQAGFEPAYRRVETAATMRAALTEQPWDVVLSDYYLPSFDARTALTVLQEAAPHVPFIVVSGSVGEDTAVAVMQAGATDYIMKDRLQRLAPAVRRAMEGAAVRLDRRRLEAQLLQSQKMEAVGRLAGGIAHDFNNVLTAVLGSIELLLLDAPTDRPHREELDIIRDAALRAKDLIRQLLAFSARQVLQPLVLDVNRLVGDLGKLLRRLLGEDIELVAQLAPDLGAVRVDAGQIEQVLVNLGVNARDAMPQGGRLTIATTNVDLAPADRPPAPGMTTGRYVLLSMSDTGIGMDEDVKAHLFEPFFTTKPRGKGTGLGLATVYGIVHQSGGSIVVDSAPGQGATFRIYLPRVEAPLDATEGQAPVRHPAAGRETILLAEDEQLVRLLTRKVLELAGYRVLVAAGGAEALVAAERHDGPIHLLLTDVVMPEMNGRELMHRLAQLRPDVRVLYMSGYADEAVARHGALDPRTAFLQKPFTPEGLARKVRAVLDEPR